MTKSVCAAIIISAIMFTACTPQEHKTLAAYRDAETRIALPPDTNCYNDAFNAWTIADSKEVAVLDLRLNEIYSNPSLSTNQSRLQTATENVFEHHKRSMEYHTDVLIQRTGWTRTQVDFCRGMWNHIKDSYDCVGIEKRARHNLEAGAEPDAWDVGVFRYCANTDLDFLEREFKTR